MERGDRKEDEESEIERCITLRFDHGEIGEGDDGAAMEDFPWRENSTIGEREAK